MGMVFRQSIECSIFVVGTIFMFANQKLFSNFSPKIRIVVRNNWSTFNLKFCMDMKQNGTKLFFNFKKVRG